MRIKYFLIVLILLLNLQVLKAEDIYDAGKEIFLGKGMCASCHTLADAKSKGAIGPNLNDIKPDEKRVISVVTNGIGVMPAFEGMLSSEEISLVSKYVSSSSKK